MVEAEEEEGEEGEGEGEEVETYLLQMYTTITRIIVQTDWSV